MIFKIGDTIKVVQETNNGKFYSIGTICKVMEVDEDSDGFYYRIVKLEDINCSNEDEGLWYKESELEKI